MKTKTLINACLTLTILCGVSAVVLAVVMAMHPGSETHLAPVVTTLTSLLATGAGAFFLMLGKS